VRSRKFTILLVDDDADWRTIVADALASLCPDTHVVELGTGEEALAYLHRRGQYRQVQRPDLVCLDVRLPDMSGQQVLGEMKSDDDLRTIPVLMLSGVDDAAARRDALRGGAARYVIKPIGRSNRLRTLLEALARWVGQLAQAGQESAV